MKLGIIGAMQVEVEILLTHMENKTSSEKAGSTFYEGMLEGILAYIDSVDVNRAIQRIYVVRKVITEQFFSSVFVVEPKKDAKPEDVDDVMDKLFNHLDTHPADWQFSLFLFDAQTARAVNRVKGSCVLDRDAKK